MRFVAALAAVVVGVAACALPTVYAQATTEVTLTLQDHRFSPTEVRVKAGAPFMLVIANKDTSVEEWESKDLRIEKIIPGGKLVRLRMPVLKAGTYGFVGEYHETTATGRIVAE